jgi:hypothetical protein
VANIAVLEDKIETVQSSKELRNSNVAVKCGHCKAKGCTFNLMLQTQRSYCEENHTSAMPKSELNFNGWVRDTRNAYKQFINEEPPRIIKE